MERSVSERVGVFPAFPAEGVAAILSSMAVSGGSYDEVNLMASALASTLSLLFPSRPPLADHPQVRMARRAASMNACASSARPKSPHHPLNDLWDRWKREGPNSSLSDSALRDKLACFLAVDVFGRIGDMTMIPVHAELCYFVSRSICCESWTFHFWNSKTTPGKLVRVIVDPYHDESHLCTPCVAREYLSRFKRLRLEPDLMVPLPSLRTRAPAERLRAVPSLFRCLPVTGTRSTLPVKALSRDRLAKTVKDSMICYGGFPDDFLARSVRSVAGSQAFNVGCPIQRVLRNGRWERQATVFSYYLHITTYVETDCNRFKTMSIPALLRIRVSVPR